MRAYIVCLLSAGLFALHGLYILFCIHVSLGSAGSLVCVCLVNSRWIYVPECVPVLSEGLFACLCVFCILVCPCPVHYSCVCYLDLFLLSMFVCVCVCVCVCAYVWFLYNSVECLRLCVCALCSEVKGSGNLSVPLMVSFIAFHSAVRCVWGIMGDCSGCLLKLKKGSGCVDWINLFGLIKSGDTQAF